MDEKSKCIFCGENKEDMTLYRQKAICNDCFDDIFDWSKEKAINDRLIRIEKLIKDFVRMR